MVRHSAADAKGPRFNSSVARAYLRLNSQASTGRQAVLAMRCTVAAVDTCGLVLRLQTWRSITNGRSEAKLKNLEGA